MPDVISKRLRVVNMVGSGALICILAAAGIGVTKLYANGRESIQQTHDLQQQLSELDGLSATLGQVEAASKQTQIRLDDAESRLPTSNAMDQFLHELAHVADQAGLQVDSTIPGKETQDAGGYTAKPVSISGSGDWDTCYKFLTGLRKMNRLTRLDSLVLEIDKTRTPPGENGAALALEKPACHMSVTISTFMAR
jgi:Tfp pilus assembly protein PilO